MMHWLESLLWTVCDVLAWLGMFAGTFGALIALSWIGATWLIKVVDE